MKNQQAPSLLTIRAIFVLLFAIQPGHKHLYGQENFIEGSPRIAYWKHGNKPPRVIVLHGGPGAAHDYLLPEWNLLASVATVMYYDQRGTGKSGRASCYSWNEHVGDLKRLIDQTCKGNKVIIAGTSWGSTLALLYAYTFPEDVKGLILSGTYNWIGQGKPSKDCQEYLTAPLKLIKDTSYYKALNVTDSKGKQPYLPKVIEVNNVSHSMTNQSMISAPALKDLAKINLPVIIFKGEKCDFVQPSEGAGLYLSVLPNVKSYLVEGACHDPWITQSKDFFEKCIRFIKLVQ